MLSLVYVSSATSNFSERDLQDLLAKARENNSRLNVTGMLLYKDGNFMQVLEGPELAVRQLFQTICMDLRHRGVIVLLERKIPERDFPDWSMAFRNLHDPALRDIPGYSEFMNQQLLSEDRVSGASKAHRLLGLFRSNMLRR